MITNSTKNKNITNISIMQHSKINIILDNNRNNYINDLKSMNNFNNNNLYNNNINNRSNYALKNFLIINSKAKLENFVNINM